LGTEFGDLIYSQERSGRSILRSSPTQGYRENVIMQKKKETKKKKKKKSNKCAEEKSVES